MSAVLPNDYAHPVINANHLPNEYVNINEPVSYTNSIPNTIEINKVKLTEVPIFKLSRYIFPQFDAGPTSAGKTKIPELNSLKYLVNVCCHKYSPELKQIYDKLCGRDVTYPEISKNGMLCTRYDLKLECSKFKKALEKSNYVTDLAHTLKGLEPDIAIARTLEVQNNKNLNLAQTNILNLKPVHLSVEMQEFVNKCKAEEVNLTQGLTRLYYMNLDRFNSLLREMIQYARSKRMRKKFMKFESFISKKIKLTHAKFSYFIRQMHNPLATTGQIRTKTLNIK